VALSDLRGRQDPHRAADTPEHAEHEDDYAGNQPQRREGWYGNPVGLIHGKPPFRTAESTGGPEGSCRTEYGVSVAAVGRTAAVR
jgi:hypothetical protein